MIPGVTAQQTEPHTWRTSARVAGSGGLSSAFSSDSVNTYVAHGVTFNSARLVCSSLSCTDNGYVGFAGWFKANWETDSIGNPFVTDPSGNYNSHYLAGTVEYASGPNTTHSAGIDLFNEPPLAEDTWQHFIGAIYTNMAAPKTRKLYVNDADVGGSASYFDNTVGGAAFTPALNGKQLVVGDNGSGFFFKGSMADVSIWPGISLITSGAIASATRRLFIDAYGRPVDPSVAIAALGAPAIMLTGVASVFRNNSLGTSGTLSIATGSLSDAATNP